jgi:hypothetical protein
MNTRYLVGLAGIILSSSLTGCFLPFTASERPRTFAETDDKIIAEMRLEGLSKASPFYLNEIDTRAVRSFVRTYWNVTDANWVTYPGGYVVYFTNNGIVNRAYYTRSGELECSIRQYTEKEMPVDIRQIVKSAYYDYSIVIVHEVSRGGKTSYVVKLEDKTSFKDIRIDDAGMEVVTEFMKSKSLR